MTTSREEIGEIIPRKNLTAECNGQLYGVRPLPVDNVHEYFRGCREKVRFLIPRSPFPKTNQAKSARHVPPRVCVARGSRGDKCTGGFLRRSPQLEIDYQLRDLYVSAGRYLRGVTGAGNLPVGRRIPPNPPATFPSERRARTASSTFSAPNAIPLHCTTSPPGYYIAEWEKRHLK